MHFVFHKIMNTTDNHHIDLSKEILYQFPNGGKVVVYNSIDRNANDFQRIVLCSVLFAKQGKQVVLTPKFNSPLKSDQYHEIYHSLAGTKYYGKCPDLCIDGVFYEHEGYTTAQPKRAFRNMLTNGLHQSDRLIIEDCGLSVAYMKRIIQNRIASGQHITEIWINGQNMPLYKKLEE